MLASVAGPGPCWERPIPRKYASGEIDHNGSITRAGDGAVRGALVQAALTLLTRDRRLSVLKAWGMAVAKRRGLHRAIVAVARKLAIILHRMWIDLGEKHEPRGDVEVQAKNGGWLTGKPLSEKDVMWWPFVKYFNTIEWISYLCFTNWAMESGVGVPIDGESAISKFARRRLRAEAGLAACGGSRADSRFDPEAVARAAPRRRGAAAPNATFAATRVNRRVGWKTLI